MLCDRFTETYDLGFLHQRLPAPRSPNRLIHGVRPNEFRWSPYNHRECSSQCFVTSGDDETERSIVALADAINATKMTRFLLDDWCIVSTEMLIGRSSFEVQLNDCEADRLWSLNVLSSVDPQTIRAAITLSFGDSQCDTASDQNCELFRSTATTLKGEDWLGLWIVSSPLLPGKLGTGAIPTRHSVLCATAIVVTRKWSACSFGIIHFNQSSDNQLEPVGLSQSRHVTDPFAQFLRSKQGLGRMQLESPMQTICVHAESKSRRPFRRNVA
jgi:hypothetical protein